MWPKWRIRVYQRKCIYFEGGREREKVRVCKKLWQLKNAWDKCIKKLHTPTIRMSAVNTIPLGHRSVAVIISIKCYGFFSVWFYKYNNNILTAWSSKYVKFNGQQKYKVGNVPHKSHEPTCHKCYENLKTSMNFRKARQTVRFISQQNAD